jgi:uncharacterized Zn finger protein
MTYCPRCHHVIHEVLRKHDTNPQLDLVRCFNCKWVGADKDALDQKPTVLE